MGGIRFPVDERPRQPPHIDRVVLREECDHALFPSFVFDMCSGNRYRYGARGTRVATGPKGAREGNGRPALNHSYAGGSNDAEVLEPDGHSGRGYR